MSATAGGDRDIAAAYSSGLSLTACAVKFGVSRYAVQGALARTGTPLRPPGAPRKLTAEGDARAAERYVAGRSARAVALELGVSRSAAVRALERDGAGTRTLPEAARLRREREAEERGEYPWAAEAAVRHQAGESVSRLAREYGTGWQTAAAAIGRQGVTVRRVRQGRPRGGAS